MSQQPPRTYMPSKKDIRKRRPPESRIARPGADKPVADKPGVRSGPHPPRPPRPADVRRARNRILFILYPILLGTLLIAMFTSPVMGVKQVQASGTNGLPAAEASQIGRILTLAPDTN